MTSRANQQRPIAPRLCAALLMLVQAPAQANVVWPALVLEGRILTWWLILFGLIIEFCLIRWLMALSPGRSLMITLVMNGVSTLAGIFLIPISGIMLSFDPFSWTMTVLTAALVNGSIELPICRLFTKKHSKLKVFLWLWGINILSVAVAALSLIRWPADT